MNELRLPVLYRKGVVNRSFIKFSVGLLARVYLYLKYWIWRSVARIRGAKIGSGSIIEFGLAKKANKNLIIGEDTIVETCKIDLRDKVVIGNHCIINRDVEIIRLSHIIDDSRTFETKRPQPLIISDYCWLATGSKILPSVSMISKGSVIGAYSVLVKDTEDMAVYSGFPAKELRKHSTIFDQLIVVSLKGGDLLYYFKARYAK